MALTAEECQPCKTGEGALGEHEITELLGQINDGWELEWTVLTRQWKFKNFALALAFVNKVGELAEAEKHHPDIEFGWGYVRLNLTTHSVNSLTRNDFIFAAKIDALSMA
ncbi:MAG: 4a-hydroxytetrahydrobiopterin dehydratase [Rickettsiales bacterium]